MKRFAVLLIVLLLAACGSSQAKAVTASDAWARFTPVNAAVYVTIENSTDDADALTSASVPPEVAGKVIIHQTTARGNDMVGMDHAPSIDLPADFTLTMKSGSYHIMLEDVKTAPAAGTSFPVTLNFQKHAPITVDAEVRA